MFGFRITAGVALAVLMVFGLQAGPKGLVWQSGQLVSMKEEGSDPDGSAATYIYQVQAKDRTYGAVLSSPLKAYIHSSVKFAVDKDSVYIQDLDGKIRKACIIPQSQTTKSRK